MELLERKDNVFSFDAKVIMHRGKYAIEVPPYIIEAMKLRFERRPWRHKQVDVYIRVGSKNGRDYCYYDTESETTIAVPRDIRSEGKDISIYLGGFGVAGTTPYVSEILVKPGKIVLRAYPTSFITLPNTRVVIRCAPDACEGLREAGILAIGERSEDMKALLRVIKTGSDRIKEGVQLPEAVLLHTDNDIYRVEIVGFKKRSRVLGPRYVRELGIRFVDTVLINISRYEDEEITKILAARAEHELEAFREAIELKERAEHYTEREIRVLRRLFGHRNLVKPFLDIKKVLYVNGPRGVGKTFQTVLAIYGLPTLYIVFDKEEKTVRVRNPTVFYKKRDEHYRALIDAYESQSLQDLIEKLRALPSKTIVVLDDIHYMYEYGYVELAQTLIKAVLNARNATRILITDTPIEYYLLNLGLRRFAWEFVQNSTSIHIENEVWNDDILKLMRIQGIEVTLPRFLHIVKKVKGSTYRDIVKELRRYRAS